jgi:hypothetical protein
LLQQGHAPDSQIDNDTSLGDALPKS